MYKSVSWRRNVMQGTRYTPVIFGCLEDCTDNGDFDIKPMKMMNDVC